MYCPCLIVPLHLYKRITFEEKRIMAEINITEQEEKKSLNFIEQRVKADLAEGKNGGRLQTRFPPEPNGYLHIGHAKAIAMDFGVAQKFGGVCNLRMDDTNPQKEDTEYVEAIERDIKWLGFQWGKVCYASDYFQDLWDFAEWCILQGRAYIDEQTSEEIAAQKGTPTEPGTNSPYRDRPAEESLKLFREMNSGNVEPGKMILRAKIDMANPNMHFRDPIMYRVLNMEHWRTGNKWNAYPMYDFTHGQSDYLEGVTHSICTLEFVEHRPLYDLFVNWMREWASDCGGKAESGSRLSTFSSQLSTYQGPRQFEFNKLNLNYTLMSKRNLLILTKEGVVNGWDDPRMPTISGLRRRGYTAASIRNFAETVGVAKRDNIIDVSLLEFCAREDLNKVARRTMAVLDPVKLVIDNYPEGQIEELDAVNNPENPDEGTRKVPFGKELWIERADFMENPPKKFFRLTVGGEVRLKYAYIIKCTHVVKDAEGNITEIHCEYYPETRSGLSESNRKVKGTIHWVSVEHAKKAEVRLFDRLFNVPDPDDCEEGQTFIDHINPNSLVVIDGYIEENLSLKNAEKHYQFERTGYFCLDKDSTEDHLVFNKTVSLKASY